MDGLLVAGIMIGGLGMMVRYGLRVVKPKTEARRNLVTATAIGIGVVGWIIFGLMVDYINGL